MKRIVRPKYIEHGYEINAHRRKHFSEIWNENDKGANVWTRNEDKNLDKVEEQVHVFWKR